MESLQAASFKQCIAGKQLSGVYYSGGKIHYSWGKISLKGPKREKLHAMHVKELIKTNYFER